MSISNSNPKNYAFEPASTKDEQAIQRIISNMDSFKNYQFMVIAGSLCLVGSKRPAWLVMLSITVIEKNVKAQITNEFVEQEMIVLATLDKDYGHVFIRPETLADKISEWFSPKEIDFAAFPDLSRKYYILADDSAKFSSMAVPELLEIIDHSGIPEFEILNNMIAGRFRQVYNDEIIKNLSDFAGKISELNG